MAYSNGTIWHIKSTGATTNGAGFNPENANFATDGTVDANTGNAASPVFSSASYTFVAGDVGAWLFIQSGTNSIPGWYQIASVSGGKATLTASVGSAVLYGTVQSGRNYHRPNGLNTAAGISTVGTPTGLVWSVDYSQGTSPRYTFTDLVIDGATNTDFTSAGNPVGVNFIGNIINITSGTGFTVQRVEVVSIPSGVIGRADKSLGTLSSTGGNGRLGGAASTIDTVLGLSLVAGNKVYIWATGTYTRTTSITLTSSVKGDATNGNICVEGCTSYMGDLGGRPTITSATNSVNLFTMNDNDNWEFVHLNITHTAATRGAAVGFSSSASGPIFFRDCVFDGVSSFNGGSVVFMAACTLDGCIIKNCTGIGISAGQSTLSLFNVEIFDCTGNGIDSNQSATLSIILNNCAIYRCAIGIETRSATAAVSLSLHNVTIHGCTSDGIKVAATSNTSTIHDAQNVALTGNGGYGVNYLDEQALLRANKRILRGFAYYNNTSGSYNTSGWLESIGEVTCTSDPWTDAANGDFTPNSVADGGALLKGAGYPQSSPTGITTTTDIGYIKSTSGGGIPSFGPGTRFKGAA